MLSECVCRVFIFKDRRTVTLALDLEGVTGRGRGPPGPRHRDSGWPPGTGPGVIVV